MYMRVADYVNKPRGIFRAVVTDIHQKPCQEQKQNIFQTALNFTGFSFVAQSLCPQNKNAQDLK